MSLDTDHLESDLRDLQPADLNDSLLQRLDACANDTWTQLSVAELAFENQLRSIRPMELSPELSASLEAAFAGVRFPHVEKIVPFPKREITTPPRKRTWWSAAAAVAITGAVTALLVPTNRQATNTVSTTSHSTYAPPSAMASDKVIPAGFNSGVSEASDQGVIWQDQNHAHRVFKMVYTDRMTFKDAAGATHQIERPRVEYIVVPAQAD